jgi:dienelactone hydrolase
MIQSRQFEYPLGEGQTGEGFLAWDGEQSAARPGILVMHQWSGPTAYERKRCEMLAELGYCAFAADIYGQGNRPQGTEHCAAAATALRSNPALMRARLAASLAALHAQPEADPGQTAAIGYCFGGGAVLELARAGADIAGVVSFHGALATQIPATVDSLRAKVLVLHGGDDPFVNDEAVSAFIAEMRTAQADWQLMHYGGVKHSFTDWTLAPGVLPGAEYNESADRRSWGHMRQFFDELFSASQ